MRRVNRLQYHWSGIRTKLYGNFLSESYPPKEFAAIKREFIAECERVRDHMRSSRMFAYNNEDYTDVITPQLFGYPTSLSTAVKSIVLPQKSWKHHVFNQNHRFRFISQYGLLGTGKNPSMYDIDLLNTSTSQNSPRKEKYSVAFVCNIESFLNLFLELFTLFAEKKQNVLFIVPRKAQSWKKLSSPQFTDLTNVKIIYIEDYYTNTSKEIFNNARTVFRAISTDTTKLKNIFTVREHSLYNYFAKPLKRHFDTYLPQVVAYEHIAKTIFEQYEVQVLVGGRPRTHLENAFYNAARKNKLRTLAFIHSYQYEMLDMFYDLGEISLVDYLFVLSEFDKQLYRERLLGTKNTKIICLGNPQMRSLYENVQKKSPAISYKKKFGINGKIVLYASSRNRLPQEILNINAICKEFGATLLLKVHPREAREPYSVLEKEGVRVLDDFEVNLYDIMKEADLVISAGSTAVLEAILLGTPGVYFEQGAQYGTNEQFFYEHFKRFGISHIQKINELRNLLQRVLNEPKQKNIKEYSKFRDAYGKAPDLKAMISYITRGKA